MADSSAETRLSASQRRVAIQAQVDPLKFATSSIQEIAAVAQVSEATVARTAQRMGFAGLPQMKAACLARHRSDSSLPETMRERLGSIGEDVEASVLRSQTEVFSRFATTFSSAEYASLLSDCGSAGRIVLYAFGTAYSVADYAAIELRRSGFSAVALTGGGHSLGDAIFRLQEGDCALTLAPIKLGTDYLKFARAASTTARSSTMVTQLDRVDEFSGDFAWLRLPQTSGTPTSETFVLWTFIDILIARLSANEKERVLAAREKLQGIRRQLSVEQELGLPASEE